MTKHLKEQRQLELALNPNVRESEWRSEFEARAKVFNFVDARTQAIRELARNRVAKSKIFRNSE